MQSEFKAFIRLDSAVFDLLGRVHKCNHKSTAMSTKKRNKLKNQIRTQHMLKKHVLLSLLQQLAGSFPIPPDRATKQQPIGAVSDQSTCSVHVLEVTWSNTEEESWCLEEKLLLRSSRCRLLCLCLLSIITCCHFVLCCFHVCHEARF